MILPLPLPSRAALRAGLVSLAAHKPSLGAWDVRDCLLKACAFPSWRCKPKSRTDVCFSQNQVQTSMTSYPLCHRGKRL